MIKEDVKSYPLNDFCIGLLQNVALVSTFSRNDLRYLEENLNSAVLKLSSKVDLKDDPDYQESNEILLDCLKNMQRIVTNDSKKVDKIFTKLDKINKMINYCGSCGRLDDNTIHQMMRRV